MSHTTSPPDERTVDEKIVAEIDGRIDYLNRCYASAKAAGESDRMDRLFGSVTALSELRAWVRSHDLTIGAPAHDHHDGASS